MSSTHTGRAGKLSNRHLVRCAQAREEPAEEPAEEPEERELVPCATPGCRYLVNTDPKSAPEIGGGVESECWQWRCSRAF